MPGNQSTINDLLAQVQDGTAIANDTVLSSICMSFASNVTLITLDLSPRPLGAELDLSDILEPTVVTGLLKGYLTRTTNAVVPLPNHKV